MTGVSFYKGMFRTGKQSTVRPTLFSDEEVQKFQQVVDTKDELGLNSAILQAFSPSSKPPTPINEQIELIEQSITNLDKEASYKLDLLYHENKQLRILVADLEKRVTLLEDSPKRKLGFAKKK